MKFDIQVPLTASQFEKLKLSENLKADLAHVLPKPKVERIRAYLNDPEYLFRAVRQFRGKSAYLLLRIQRPMKIISFPHKVYSRLVKLARSEGVTLNQFIKAAVRQKLDREGVK